MGDGEVSKRYYYTDPLAAAWMAKHHGFWFLTYHNDENIHFGIQGLLEEFNRPTQDKYYIHPDSLPILEPVEGDTISFINMIGKKDYGVIEFLTKASFLVVGHGFGLSLDYIVNVAMRNGIAFMWPESEEVL